METELEKLRRANAELQAWVRDLLVENRTLRARVVDEEPPVAEPAARNGERRLAACS